MSELAVVALALSAKMATSKTSRKAIRRCRKRTRRAAKKLKSSPPVHVLHAVAMAEPEKAVEWLKRVCGACQRCKGV